jgi:TolA-binding protein
MSIIKNILVFTMMFSLISCSMFKRRGSSSKEQLVPKTQYNQLLNKYEKLLAEKRMQGNVKSSSKSDQHQQLVGQNNKLSSSDSKRKGPPQLDDSVDFLIDELYEDASTKKARPSSNSKMKLKSVHVSNDRKINQLINKINLGKNFLAQEKFKNAMEAFKDLEFSSEKQIRTAANYYIAETLFQQQEYDLAMQSFEKVVQSHAFSGFTIQSIEKIIMCSKKLNLPKRTIKYESILNDLFNYK